MTALRHARELLGACRDRNWARAIDRCDELHEGVSGLHRSVYLKPAERKILRSRIDDIRLVLTAIETLRADRKASRLLESERDLISRLIAVLKIIETRFRENLLELS